MSRTTEPSCGSTQANAKRARYSFTVTRVNSSGQLTSVRKKKAKPKLQQAAFLIQIPTTFSHFYLFLGIEPVLGICKNIARQ
jgi:hypothetical protein